MKMYFLAARGPQLCFFSLPKEDYQKRHDTSFLKHPYTKGSVQVNRSSLSIN